MTTYLWGVATPILILLAALIALYAPGMLRGALGHHVRHTEQALKLLNRKEQQKILDFWRAPSRYRDPNHQPLTNAYTKREDVYGSEQVLTTGDTTAFTHYGPLLPRFLKWGLYPTLAAGIPQIAEETRQAEREQEMKRQRAQRTYREQSAARESAEAAALARVTELLGDDHTQATFIHYPSGHLKPGLDTVIYLPEAPEHEPDPDRPGVMVKSPALAVHINTSGGYAGLARAYMRGHGQYHGLNLERRLRQAHPHIYANPNSSPATE